MILSLFTLCFSFSGAFAQTVPINAVTSPTATNLNAVCIVNNITSSGNDLTKLDAWAVGDAGTIVHWNGNSWTTVTSPTTDNLYGVIFTNATNGWAVGGTPTAGGSATRGSILHYNGTWSIWTRISFSGFTDTMDTINNTLYSVTVDSSNTNGWIVGAAGLTLNWNGDTWFAITNVSPNTLRSVAMAHGSSNAWAVGDAGTIMHWTGTTWETMTSPTNAPLYAIHMVNANSGWAGGGSGNSGVVLNMSGSTWNVVNKFVFGPNGTTSQTVNSTIYSITVGNTTSAWACGSNGFVMYWTGTNWECNANLITGNLKGISMIHDTMLQAWTVGDGGRILAFNGTNWVPELPIIAIPLILGIGLLLAFIGKSKLLRRPMPLK